MFQPATRSQSKLRLAITGPSGSGKTYGALQIAKGLGGKIAFIDTEHGSASLYSHIISFDVLELAPPYSPNRFIAAISAAEAAGYDIIIIDSITHEWSGKGGCLEMNEQTARARFRGNTWSAWSETNKEHQAFVDAILRSKCHIIACARSKTETAQIQDNGKTKVTKLGMKAEQRDGIEYEFTTVLDLVHDGHSAIATKDRTGLFAKSYGQLSPEVGTMLANWLKEGKPLLEEQPAPRLQPMNSAEAKRSGEWERLTEILDECNTHEDLENFTAGNVIAIQALPDSYMDDWQSLVDAQTTYCDLVQGMDMQATFDGLKQYWTAKWPEIRDLPPHLKSRAEHFKEAKKAQIEIGVAA